MILLFPTSQHTALEEARDSERPSPSPQLPAHEKAHDSEKSSPGLQPPPHDEAQDSAEKPSLAPQPSTHEDAHEFLERPSRSSQPPLHEEAHSSENPSHSSQPPTHEQERHVSIKGPRSAKRKTRAVPAKRQRDEEGERMKQERRRLENERRLEGQRLEYERKVDARRKAEEAAAAAAARAQSEGEKRSTNGEDPQRLSGNEEALRVGQRRQQQQPLMEENVKVERREDAEGGSPMAAIKMDDDQNVHNDDDAKTAGAPGPRVLEHDTGATCLAITDDEQSKPHLIMMAHVSYSSLSLLSALGYDDNEKTDHPPTVIVHRNVQSASTMFLAPPSPPITPRDPSDSSHSGLGYWYYGKDDVAHQCHYRCQCGLVREDLREDSQTGMESNYLFEPLRLPSPKPVESVQTRQDATDVLFQPSLERSGDSVGTAVVVTVIIPRVKTQYYIRNNGVSTPRDITHDLQRGRRAGRGGYGGFRSRGRGGRGPRDEMS
jgi:hypothetical protein